MNLRGIFEHKLNRNETMRKIDLTDKRDFSKRLKYPILYRVPWQQISVPSSLPWQPKISNFCDRCGRRLSRIPWDMEGTLCTDCETYLTISIEDQQSTVTSSPGIQDDYETVFVSDLL